jgi:hypothetical protein
VHAIPQAKAWAAHVARLLLRSQRQPVWPEGGEGGQQRAQQPPGCASGRALPAEALWHGEARLVGELRGLLARLWAAPASARGASGAPAEAAAAEAEADAVRWLRSLEAALRQQRQQQQRLRGSGASARASAQGGGRASALEVPLEPSSEVPSLTPGPSSSSSSSAANQPRPAVAMALASLLAHPSPCVRVHACAAARELFLLVPQASLPLLPLVTHLVGRPGAPSTAPAPPSSGLAGRRSSPPDAEARAGAEAEARARLALLCLLPAMTADTGVAPLALRALQPLGAPGAPVALQCLGLRLMAETYLATGARPIEREKG